jgi:hypothetical protein
VTLRFSKKQRGDSIRNLQIDALHRLAQQQEGLNLPGAVSTLEPQTNLDSTNGALKTYNCRVVSVKDCKLITDLASPALSASFLG